MDSNESCWMDQAVSILDQLLKFTGQLAEFENDPDVDAKALADACAMRLNEMKNLMPQELKSSASEISKNELLCRMRDLYTRTQTVLDVLERKNNRVSAKIQTLSKSKKAINAYSTGKGYKPSNPP